MADPGIRIFVEFLLILWDLPIQDIQSLHEFLTQQFMTPDEKLEACEEGI